MNLKKLILCVALSLLAQTVVANPAVDGKWEMESYNTLINPIHAGLMYKGSEQWGIFLIGGSENNPRQGQLFTSATVDVENGTVTKRAIPWDFFCSSMTQTKDGKIFVVGGHNSYATLSGQKYAAIYNPVDGSWTMVPDMQTKRWYPSVTLLGGDNNSFVVTGGQLDKYAPNTTTQVFNSATPTWSPEYPAPALGLYPRQFLMKDGKVLIVGPNRVTRVFNPLNGSLTNVGTFRYPAGRAAGGAVLLTLSPENGYTARVLIAGGYQPAATSTAELLTYTGTQSRYTWTPVPSMQYARVQHNTTLLPNGHVLVTGGSATHNDPNPA